jgi:hypothetical protein
MGVDVRRPSLRHRQDHVGGGYGPTCCEIALAAHANVAPKILPVQFAILDREAAAALSDEDVLCRKVGFKINPGAHPRKRFRSTRLKFMAPTNSIPIDLGVK